MTHEQMMALQVLKIYRMHYSDIDPDSEEGDLILEVISRQVRSVLN